MRSTNLLSAAQRRTHWAALLFLLWGTSAPLVADGPGQPIPLEDFFRPALLGSPQMNAAGTHLVALADTKDDRTVAIIYDLVSGEKQVLGGRRDRDVYAAHWLDDRRLLLSQSEGKRYAEGMFVVDVSKPQRPYLVARDSAAVVVGVPKRKPLHPIVWVFRDAYSYGRDIGALVIDASRPTDDDAKGGSHIIGLKTELETARVLTRFPSLPNGVASAYVADHRGELAYGVAVEDGRAVLYVLQNDRWIRSPLDLDTHDLVDVGEEPGEWWAVGPAEDGRPGALVRLDATSGEIRAVVYEDEAYECTDAVLIRNPADRRVKGFRYTREGAVTVWLDEAVVPIQRKIDELLPDATAKVVGVSADEQRWIVEASADVSPPAFYVLDLKTQQFSRLGSSAPWIDSARMRPMQVVRYKARDGAPIEGYLTLPAGISKDAPGPLIVLPHGGPWRRDRWGWDPEVQFFVSRGYAVFQPNYRGSTSTSWRFSREECYDFMKMHEDVTDGVRRLLRMGLFDARRVAIVGSSFGGYLALCGAAYEPELYACAVTVAGVFDWERLLREARSSFDRDIQYQVMRRALGDPRQQAARFEAISPTRRVAAIKAPVLVAHGRSDNVVDAEQSTRLIAALKQHGVPHEALIKRDEGHGMSRLANRVELYRTIESFLARHVPAGNIEDGATISQR